MNDKRIFVFTDFDLDGATSLLILHWALKVKLRGIDFKTTTVTNFRKDFLKWAESNKVDDFENVYFLDLDVSNCADLVDRKNSIIIDHHSTHVGTKDVYKNADVTVVETTSCSKLLYNIFKSKMSLSNEQKYLVALADDYDNYQFKLPETYDLNCLFSNTQRTLEKSRNHKYIERFYEGFTGFNQQEKNIIEEHVTKKNKAIKELKIYHGIVSISKQPMVITGTFSTYPNTRYVNEICDHLLKNYNSDITFFINLENSHVSFRKKKDCPVNLAKFAEKLINGGGHDYAAGGQITETFMEFTKQLEILGA